MVASPKITHQHTIYAVSDNPRELTPADLAFVCQYTGKSSDTVLPHVLEVWRDTKKQARAVHVESACNDMQGRHGSWYESQHMPRCTAYTTQSLVACSSGSSNAYRSSCFLHQKSQLTSTTRLCKQHSAANTVQNCCIWYSQDSSQLLQPYMLLCTQSPQVLLQDIGCCYGQDTRQLIVDGWNKTELIALDLVPDYWCVKYVCVMFC